MYTPGTIIKLGLENERLGVVLESSESMVKYLELSKDLTNVKSNMSVYPLTSDSYDMSIEKPDVMYVHLDVICIADGEFKVVGRFSSNETYIELLTYLNGYRNYAKMIKDRIDVDITQTKVEEQPVSLRKTV